MLPPLWRWGESARRLDAHWRSGGIVAIPTESTYGLAVDPTNSEAVAAILRCKGRAASQPLPVVAGAATDLASLGVRLDLPVLAPVLAAWPAPLTAVVPLIRPLAATLGRETVAVRIPAHDRLRRLLLELGRAVTATSANLSGKPPVTTTGGVRELLVGEPAIVIEEHGLPGGPPSTIVGIRRGELIVLREGRYPVEGLLAV